MSHISFLSSRTHTHIHITHIIPTITNFVKTPRLGRMTSCPSSCRGEVFSTCVACNTIHLWMRCSVVQCVAVCCSVLHVAQCIYECVAAWCSVLQCVAVCWSVLHVARCIHECVAVWCSVVQCVACSTMHLWMRCSVMQWVALCCIVLQCVAVCCM
jgi:hypothetical protein